MYIFVTKFKCRVSVENDINDVSLSKWLYLYTTKTKPHTNNKFLPFLVLPSLSPDAEWLTANTTLIITELHLIAFAPSHAHVGHIKNISSQNIAIFIIWKIVSHVNIIQVFAIYDLLTIIWKCSYNKNAPKICNFFRSTQLVSKTFSQVMPLAVPRWLDWVDIS